MDDDGEKTLAETENYEAWASEEDDGEEIFHLDLGRVTIHFFREEWDESIDLMKKLPKGKKGKK